MSTAPDKVRGAEVNVVFVMKKDAKAAKNALEASGLLNKDFRMVPVTADLNQETPSHDCIALPVSDDAFAMDNAMEGGWKHMTVSTGRHVCPFSTKVLGNRRELSHAPVGGEKLTLVQQAIVRTVAALRDRDGSNNQASEDKMIGDLQRLDRSICPIKLEFFGDDRTLVIPQNSFEGKEFDGFVSAYVSISEQSHFSNELWKQFSLITKSPRVVRRGTVDPESGIRESGHRLLFPSSGVSDETGPASPGWIKVTEQGIKQSFDMTRVMFSRGNISEKIRFGKLVNEGEVVLDLYAGIGYYTLPALVIGKASRVYACEWNDHAANALRFNIKDNHVEDRATVLVGDSRVLAQEHNLVNMFDRVSLGLLPSSEGGWNAGVRSIRNDTGGWLHIHGNVPVKEVDSWALWLVNKLRTLALEQGKPISWIFVCDHVEKVKSFAPTVAHYVADVYIGSIDRYTGSGITRPGQAGVVADGTFHNCPDSVELPSCALSPDNVLSQQWMR
jgi:tRNA G37 N-methylase Trm5